MRKTSFDAESIICAVRAAAVCLGSAAITFSGGAHAYEEPIPVGGGGGTGGYTSTIATIATQANSAGYSKVTIPKGSQYSTWPSWVSTKPSLKYNFAFDPSAIYQHPDNDQWDWNKLPGVSDCGTLDLKVNGAMFGWRWIPGTQKLQITAYANRNSVHQSWDSPGTTFQNQVQLIELNKSDIMQFAPLTYEIKLEPLLYRFSIQGVLPSGRTISSVSTLPRKCSKHPLIKHGSTMFFGGTKVAPHKVTGHVKWLYR